MQLSVSNYGVKLLKIRYKEHLFTLTALIFNLGLTISYSVVHLCYIFLCDVYLKRGKIVRR
jgi:hypothetical protein